MSAHNGAVSPHSARARGFDCLRGCENAHHPRHPFVPSTRNRTGLPRTLRASASRVSWGRLQPLSALHATAAAPLQPSAPAVLDWFAQHLIQLVAERTMTTGRPPHVASCSSSTGHLLTMSWLRRFFVVSCKLLVVLRLLSAHSSLPHCRRLGRGVHPGPVPLGVALVSNPGECRVAPWTSLGVAMAEDSLSLQLHPVVVLLVIDIGSSAGLLVVLLLLDQAVNTNCG